MNEFQMGYDRTIAAIDAIEIEEVEMNSEEIALLFNDELQLNCNSDN